MITRIQRSKIATTVIHTFISFIHTTVISKHGNTVHQDRKLVCCLIIKQNSAFSDGIFKIEHAHRSKQHYTTTIYI